MRAKARACGVLGVKRDVSSWFLVWATLKRLEQRFILQGGGNYPYLGITKAWH